MLRFLTILVLSLLAALSISPLAAQNSTTLTLITHDSFNVSETVLSEFEQSTGIKVQILPIGDAGAMVNQAILTRTNPLGDVLFGVDNTFLSRALQNDLFEPYESPLLEEVAEAFKTDPKHRVTPVDYGDVCLNYDIAYFEEADLAVPTSLADLTRPEYRKLLVVQNPATSSPGLAFLLLTIAEFGTDGDYTYLDFWADLVANEVLIVDGWTQAYFTHFTQGSDDGTYPLVVSYASSPPFTVDDETGEPTTASITADGMCFRQIEYAGILKGTQQRQAAEQFIDFLLSVPFQEDLPLQMYVFPVNPNAELPELFAKHAAIPANPVLMSVDEIELGREEWVQTWTETVLR
ncbi:MAG: thiamine ABC transporter substrate-binding protein [Aggregatilineales bacterium]